MLRNEPHTRLTQFEKLKDILCLTSDGIILKDNKIVIPQSLISTCLERAHTGHTGHSQDEKSY